MNLPACLTLILRATRYGYEQFSASRILAKLAINRTAMPSGKNNF
jgi:hypothetical protein